MGCNSLVAIRLTSENEHYSLRPQRSAEGILTSPQQYIQATFTNPLNALLTSPICNLPSSSLAQRSCFPAGTAQTGIE